MRNDQGKERKRGQTVDLTLTLIALKKKRRSGNTGMIRFLLRWMRIRARGRIGDDQKTSV